MMPHPHIRTRRVSACHRHPTQPVTGFCPLCLTDRLAGLDSSSSPAPEFRRSKSVAGEVCKALSDLVLDQRRSSCDVRVRNTLSDLFVVDDTCKARDGLQLKDLGGLKKEIDNHDNGDREVRVSDDVIVRNVIEDDDEVMEGDLKTMKEIIDMELQNRRRDLRSAASVFGRKLRKWRQKQKEKKQSRVRSSNAQSEVADYGFGRRSCDTEPRFSIDTHRLSVEDARFSLDEHRASWDGYMVARTIPRLTPMLSVVDNMVLAPVNRVTVEKLQMHSISEDGASSSGSGQSNSDCFSSNRGSSSNSMKSSSTKTAGFGVDDGKAASNARVSPASDVVFQGTKLVITEKELKNWHLNSIKNNNSNSSSNAESASNAPNSTSKTSTTNLVIPSNEHKKKVMSSRWRKVCNLWGKKSLEHTAQNRVEIGNSSAKLVGTPSSVNSRTRRDEFVLDRTRSTRYSTNDIDSGLLRLYLTPFRNSRRNKYGRSRVPSIMATNGLQPR